jgi:S-formylglutathione hydrolase FrmB
MKVIKFFVYILVIFVIVLGILVGALWIFRPVPLPASVLDFGSPWESTRPVYHGAGMLIAYMDEDAIPPEGSSVEFRAPLESGILGEKRPLIVYLPPGYEEKGGPYPVIFALHGFASRPQSWVRLLVDPLESAIVEGVVPPVVVVFVDFSLSGNGMNDPETPFDDRGGSWYINSNRGRFEDHFFSEIVPFVRSHFSVSSDPEEVVLVGSSMGGFGVLYYGIMHPDFSHIIVPMYPDADLRYAIYGNRIADYDPAGYAPIVTDEPKRIINGSVWGGLFGVTEEWIFYPVFDSDEIPGEVWSEDRPVWERLMAVNPVEVLERESPDLGGQRYYILVGGKDDFNLNAHLSILLPLLSTAGAAVHPEVNIIPGGRHKPEFIAEHIDEIVTWIGGELK